MNNDTEQAIDEVLDGRPRALEIAEMIKALVVRRKTFMRELDACPDDESRKSWNKRIKAVDQQIYVLREEQAITEFVENEVRAVANRPLSENAFHDPYG